jgi:hypothetical protein
MDPQRAFDFWLGEWEVHSPTGELAGTNRIELVLGGAALQEHWSGVRGLLGSSFSLYVPDRDAWHQTWVDSTGSLLLLDGGPHEGAMVLEGDGASPDDPSVTVRHRISWSLVGGDPDRVRQHWQSSTDGTRWETLFDGRYQRIR